MIGDHKWISRLKRSSSKYKIYDIIFKLKSQLDSLHDYKLLFYLSALISHFQLNKNFDFNINIDDMIFLSPDYKYLLEGDKLDESNIDFKLSLDKSTKLINIGTNKLDINTETLCNIEEDYLILVRDKSPDDNLILILPKPSNYDQTGGEFVHNNNSVNLPGMQAGVGYNPTVHTRKGYDIGQYFAASLDIDDVSTEHQDHNSNQYPGDPLFGVKKLEGLIDQKKKNVNNFEKGFSVGFDNGYNKGYYFGYSSAAAYLYRYYKKFYKEYMEKYKEKLIEKETNENYDNYYDDQYYNENMSGGFLNKEEEEEKKVFINDQLTKITGHDFTYEPFLDKEKIKELDNDPMYKGLPDYMMPENTFSLVALQPRKHSILELVSQFFLPTKKFANPSLHCKKPSQEDLNHMFRLNFHPKFRDGIVSADKNWNERIFRKSCNKYSLMLMKYCPNDLHRGVEYDTKTGYFYKVCKRKTDEEGGCIIM